jgi:hypothetical protein
MITADDKVGPPTKFGLQCRGQCLSQIIGSIVGSFEVEERLDLWLTSYCTPRPVVSRIEVVRRISRLGHVMPADPHHPQVGNLEISANAKAFGEQATREHDRHRKNRSIRLARCSSPTLSPQLPP